MARLFHIAAALAMNAVPVYGLLVLDWSPAVLLVLFWVESMIAGLANVVRIVLHRRATGRAGHQVATLGAGSSSKPATVPVSYITQYAGVFFLFTLAHGVFLALLLAMASSSNLGGLGGAWLPDAKLLGAAVITLLIVAVADLTVDLVGIDRRSFAWLKIRVERALPRVAILHLAIIFGMTLMMKFETPLAPLVVILLLKVLFDVLRAAYKGEGLPARPPRWFLAVARKTGHDGEAEWNEIVEEQQREEQVWEQPVVLD